MKSITGRQVLIFSLILGSLCISSQAQAADGTSVLNNIADRYQAQASAWQGAISAAATRLFWSLALISMVWTFGMMALRKADIQEMFAELVRYLMFTGFFFFLLSNASAIAKAIMNSLTQLASTASGLPPITPSGIMDVGFNVLATVLTKSSLWSPVDSALGIAVGLIILVVLALVAINMLILLVSGWILAYAGIFFLGFGGSRWTSDMAINYYKTVLGIAASLMGMTLIVGIGQAFLNEYYASIGDASFSDLAVILVVALILLHLVNKIPTLISGIITGASVGGASAMGGAGAGTALAAAAMAGAAAAGAVAAVASSATGAAGWGSAINAAMKQGGGSSGADTGVGGMPNMAGAGGGSAGNDGSSGSGNTTPLGAAMGDTGSTGASSFGWPSSMASNDMQAGAQDTQGSNGPQGRSAKAKASPGGAPSGGDFASAAEGRSASPGNSGRSALGALGAGIAAVASGKAGSVMDSVKHQVAQTTGGKVAAEIRSPGSAAAERQNKADIHNSQTVAGKAQAARAFMATGLSSSPMPPAFTGDSLAAFSNPEKSIDAEAEISAFVNRKPA
jgi:type IV secretion system protein VirB6/type IV secretion system protein TrbL